MENGGDPVTNSSCSQQDQKESRALLKHCTDSSLSLFESIKKVKKRGGKHQKGEKVRMMSIKDILAPAAETFAGVRYGPAAKAHHLAQNKPQPRNLLKINLNPEIFFSKFSTEATQLYFFL